MSIRRMTLLLPIALQRCFKLFWVDSIYDTSTSQVFRSNHSTETAMTHREFCVSGSTFRSAKIKSLEVPPFLVHYSDMLLLGTIMKDDYISYHFYAYDTQLYLPIYHHFLWNTLKKTGAMLSFWSQFRSLISIMCFLRLNIRYISTDS